MAPLENYDDCRAGSISFQRSLAVSSRDQIETKVGSRRIRRRGVFASILFHVVLLFILLSWYLPRHPTDSASQLSNRGVQGVGELGTDRLNNPSLPSPTINPQIPAEQIEASLRSQIDQIEKLPAEQQLSELQKKLHQLDSLSSEESLNEVTETLANTFGLTPGESPNEDAPPGVFDPQTAQIHDVTRTKMDNGSWKYESILVDAEGRTELVPMNATEGKTTYDTFQQMKQFPMAAGIYRQIVMPLIQKMIETSEAAKQITRDARQLRPANSNGRNQEVDDPASPADERSEL